MIAKESLQFLDDLRKNNNRDWFLANKKRYETYKENYHALVSDFIKVMSTYDEKLESLAVKDCKFRINRDIRFSKDKSPYKSHMGIWMSPGQKNTNLAGYYIHIEPGKSFIAGGKWQPEAADLKKIRKEIEFFHDDLDVIFADKNFKSEFDGFDTEDSLKTAPKGFEKDHEAIHHLKLKSFIVTKCIDDKELTNKNFVQKMSAKLALIKPVNDFLNRALTTSE
ncbi:MAG: DUF2461 domain-containing protein [Flavobacterium sp.]|uniref:DUF2461 domain-containing protein n=1 Tax=Flavobacterium sp. TaxID=239 RepID=UPI0012047032|nr:DUF2461 domain-containing protein [Flavobacterium sp.]RZJ67075.1 MAG: DUF2461 domain-containing protein [Flavobacterium sp.]